MTKTRKTLPYDEAKRYVQLYCPDNLKTKDKYLIWYAEGSAPFLPKYPERSYQHQWLGWNDFLGTNNVWGNTAIQLRPFWEAVRFTQTLGLKTEKEWMKYADTDKKPDDIPKWPGAHYKEFKGTGWTTWLGITAVSKMVSAEHGRENGIYAIVHEKEDPGNVITLLTDLNGKTSFMEAQIKNGFSIIATYKFEEDMIDKIHATLNKHSTIYYGQENKRVVRNLNELKWEMDSMLLMLRL